MPNVYDPDLEKEIEEVIASSRETAARVQKLLEEFNRIMDELEKKDVA